MYHLGQARYLREDQSERPFRRKAKRLKKAIGPIMEAWKTKMLTKIDNSESNSDDGGDGLSRGNNDTSHVKHQMIQTTLKEMNDL